MRVVVIIQARMGSTRLPGKVLADIAGEPMLKRVVERAQRITGVDEVVVATSDKASDDVIVHACQTMNCAVERGSEQDVLDRYYQAATRHRAEAVMRITSDCPLIDPEVSGKVLRVFLDEQPDYASNVLQRCYPRGLDTEVVSREALERAWHEATQHYERVHVTSFIDEHPDRFRLVSVAGERVDRSHHRWTVDTPEDLALVRAIYERLGKDGRFGWRDVLALLEREPALAELNRHVRQKETQEG